MPFLVHGCNRVDALTLPPFVCAYWLVLPPPGHNLVSRTLELVGTRGSGLAISLVDIGLALYPWVYAAHYLKVNEEANYIKVNKKGKKDPGIEWRTEQLAWGG
jgi:hypothetical protein